MNAGFNRDMRSTLFEKETFGSGVPVIWATPRFRHPHSQNPSDMGIPSHITLAIWVRVTGDAHITRVWRMGMLISL